MIELEKIKIPGSHEEEGGPHSFFKVPIGIVIQRLLQFDDVYEEWTCSSARVPGVYSSYKDGEAFQSSLFFSNHPDGLHIHLYLDDDHVTKREVELKITSYCLSTLLGDLGRKFRATYRFIYLPS